MNKLEKRMQRLEAAMAAETSPRANQPRFVPAEWGELLSEEWLAALPNDDRDRVVRLCELRLQAFGPGQDGVRRKIIRIFYNDARTYPDPAVVEEWRQRYLEEESTWAAKETLH